MAYTDPQAQRILDAEHLRLLSLFHYVSGGVTLAFSMFFGVGLLFMSAMFAFLPPPPHGPGAAELRGPPMAFLGFFALFCALGMAYGISKSSPVACLACGAGASSRWWWQSRGCSSFPTASSSASSRSSCSSARASSSSTGTIRRASEP